MGSQGFSFDLFDSAPLIGIMRNMPIDTLMQVAHLFADAGFTNLEVTMNTPNASGLITNLRTEFPQINIGAGTVTTLAELDAALTAGAQFIVTPITIKEVIQQCSKRKVPIFAGALTPTEIFQAWTWGATAVKVFPANDLGPSYIKNVLAPLDKIQLIPTGGINTENMKAYFDNGAKAVGLGGSLFDKNLIADQDFGGLAIHFKKYKDVLDNAISKN